MLFRSLTQSAVEREIENVAFLLHNNALSVVVLDLPRRLHTERRLEICFRAFQIAQHEDARPRANGDAGSQLSAGERYGIRDKRVSHRSLYG